MQIDALFKGKMSVFFFPIVRESARNLYNYSHDQVYFVGTVLVTPFMWKMT